MTLVGHGEAVDAIRAAAAGGRLHHAWLLAGPRGVGKGRFARDAATWLLAQAAGPTVSGPRLEVPEEHPTARLVAAGSHPDLRILERLAREGGGLARGITVDQVRALGPMLGTTPSLSSRRVVIVDAVDDLERAGANALLKSLEEPPAGTVFLLVSHAPGRLLPTIQSRCRSLRFGRLPDAEVATVLAAELPEAPAAERGALVAVAEGAPGRAIGYAGLDVAGLERAIASLIEGGDPTRQRAAALAKALASRAQQARYEAFLDLGTTAIAAAARTRSGPALAHAIMLWEKARDLAEAARGLSFDPQGVVFELAGLLAALAPDPSHG